MQPEFQPDSREFLVRRLAGHTRPPETDLYHYTGGNGLIKIIHSGTLLVSQIGCLNDSMEVTYAFDLLQERMTQVLQDRSRAPMHEVFHQIIRRLGSFRPEAMSVYVTSFTEDGDSLS